jgi:hypothetical protein
MMWFTFSNFNRVQVYRLKVILVKVISKRGPRLKASWESLDWKLTTFCR